MFNYEQALAENKSVPFEGETVISRVETASFFFIF